MEKFRSFIAVLLLGGLLAPAIQAEPCQMPDNGTGTADFPPLCEYAMNDPIVLSDGFPAGTGLLLQGPMNETYSPVEEVGGILGGTIATFYSFFNWEVTGFGELDGYQRELMVPIFCEIHTGPRGPDLRTQTFPLQVMRLEGGIFTDPDFSNLMIVAGTIYTMPGTGETTLTELPTGDYYVESFFDISYQVDFVGAPGSPLAEYAGSEIGLFRLETEREEWDFGDAPALPFPTLLADNGPRHFIDEICYLGSAVDGEADGQSDPFAEGDDNNLLDDEDGIDFFEPLVPGNTHTIEVVASSDGFFNLWFDFNFNGSWADPADQVFTDEPLGPGVNELTFSVPAGAGNGYTFARARFCPYPGLDYFGAAEGGEVEDYLVSIEQDVEWKMHFPQYPDLTDQGVDVFMEDPVTLADDFRCTSTGPVTDITIWCSWKWDEFVPGITFFELGLWSDIPEGPDGYSQPGNLLWSRQFAPDELLEEQFHYVESGEWWYNPVTGDCFFPGDFWVWQYDFNLPLEEAFVQEEGTIYWLSVKAFQPEDPDWALGIGWKSSHLHWNDDAVWRLGTMEWNELVYPGQHPLEGQSMDLAFLIDGPDMLEPPQIWMELVDWTWTMHWDPVPGAVGYNIWSSNEPYSPWPSADWMLETTIPTNSWLVPLTASKRFYRVTAYN